MRVLAVAAIVLITSFAVPAFAEEDPAKAEANKAEQKKKKEKKRLKRRTKTRSRGRPANSLSRKQTLGEAYANQGPSAGNISHAVNRRRARSPRALPGAR